MPKIKIGVVDNKIKNKKEQEIKTMNKQEQKIATIIGTVACTDTTTIAHIADAGFKNAELNKISVEINNLIADVNGVVDNNTKAIAKLIASVESNKAILKADGFDKTADWTAVAFGYNASTTSKLIRVYKLFLENDKMLGSSPASSYTVGQLQELLTAKPEHLEQLNPVLDPSLSAKSIRALLKELKNPTIEQKTDSVVDNKTKNDKTETVVDNTSEAVEAEIVELDFLTELKLKLAQLKEYTDNAEALELAQKLIAII